MAVVAASNHNSLLLQEALHPTCGLPVKLDIRDLALLVDQGEGVHSKALHVTIIQWDAYVILEEGELQCTTTVSRTARPACSCCETRQCQEAVSPRGCLLMQQDAVHACFTYFSCQDAKSEQSPFHRTCCLPATLSTVNGTSQIVRCQKNATNSVTVVNRWSST